MTLAHITQLAPAVLEDHLDPGSNSFDHGPSSTKSNLLYGQAIANPKQDADPKASRMLHKVSALSPRHDAIKSALKDYLTSNRSLKEIAEQHSYTASALLYWIRKLRLSHRPRGRQVESRPSQNHRRVIELVRLYGVSETARRERVSKQRISQIVCRWAPELKGWRPTRTPVAEKPPKRRQRKRVVISFRISEEDWKRLLDPPSFSHELKMSGSERARAIVLKHLGQTVGDGIQPAQTPSHQSTSSYREIVNVYNFQVA